MEISLAILIIIAFWLILLTGAVIWFLIKFRVLVLEAKGKDLVAITSKLIEKDKENIKRIGVLENSIKTLTVDNLNNLQKMELIRFNPFNETGGDHSFSVAILNGKNDGLIMTGLHTRERTRIYIKGVKKGSSEHELSKEEGEALKRAVKK